MENSRQKFYYKLCISSKNKFYLYMQRGFEVSIGQTLTQDISSPSPYLYVYKTPESAISGEIGYTSKDFLNKLSTKTVLKLMCWGPSLENPRKSAFTNMTVVENIGFQKNETSAVRATSKMRNTKQGSNRREISPRNIKVARENSPARIYTSVVARKKSPTIAQNYFSNVRNKGKVYELLQKMKEETEKLDQEAKDIEKWNKVLGFEDLETVNSADNLERTKGK